MSYVPILHLTIPAIWVSVILAAIAASLLQRFVSGNKTGDWYWNAVALYILAWKLSYILFNFEHFINMPLSLLYFNGGLLGHLLAVLLVMVYLVAARNKHTELAEQAVLSVLLFFLAYQVFLKSFDKLLLEAALHALLLIISIGAIRLLKVRQDIPASLMLALLFTLELLILSLFGPLFTWLNTTFITLAAITTLMYIRHEPKGRTL